ncbi:hypothetical protein KEM56_002936 [Ascosphaera pollenicola]|nr:hypothetical protein KEM56_002936 [Ascosphaera pollenicola]
MAKVEENSSAEDATLAPVSLLKKFDQLREKNIAQHVALPQIVVVGDQSSGKSSVLESLTKIPFPRDVDLCTRYATQITSRRDAEEYVNISIIPGPNASDAHREQVLAYHPKLVDADDFAKEFPHIVFEVHEKMGIRLEASDHGQSMFSDDILKIEICGPEKDYLTVIDVPGIFRNITEGSTTREDMDLVKNMVTSYIENPRTIILAILPANVDVATQEILSLASDYDKRGERTIGVLTKPDTVSEASMQNAVCSLILGKKKPLALGYYLVKNRGPDDHDPINYDKLDAIFSRRPWGKLPKERVGIRSLKKALGILLAQITKKEFPAFKADINAHLSTCRIELESLGAARQTEKQQIAFLGSVAEKFQELVRSALASRYADPFFNRNKEAKLLTYIANLSEVYSDVFEQAGPLRRFAPHEGAAEDNEEETKEDRWNDTHVKEQKKFLDGIARSYCEELDEIIEPLVFEDIDMPMPKIMEWIEGHYLSSRGLELGTIGSDVVASAFTEQSRKWGDITKAYMSQVIMIIHRFFKLAFDHVCPDTELRDALWMRLSDEVLSRYQAAIKEAEFLEELERCKSPFTLNMEFTRLLRALMSNRTQSLLSSASGIHTNEHGQTLFNIEAITEMFKSKTNLEHIKEQVHDILQSYYDIARKRFVDNVFQQAVDHRLLSGPDSPLRVFTQQWVLDLDAEDLDMIAGESAFTKERRNLLEKKIQDLEEAIRILR